MSILVNTGVNNNFKPPLYPKDGGQIRPGSTISFKAMADAKGAVQFYAYTGTGKEAVPAFTTPWPYTAPAYGSGQSNTYQLLPNLKDGTLVTLSLTDPLSGGPNEGANGTINVGGGDPDPE